jgi:hypothetical protein
MCRKERKKADEITAGALTTRFFFRSSMKEMKKETNSEEVTQAKAGFVAKALRLSAREKCGIK